MGLNKKGIRQLAKALVANQEFYNQDTFPVPSEECGTVGCLAGMCYRLSVTERTYQKNVKTWEDMSDGDDKCRPAGIKLLGLNFDNHWKLPQIFQSIENWPVDLQKQYKSDGPKWRVISALKALQRLLPDGTIDKDIKAVHTSLKPLLDKMLKTKAKKAA